MRGGIKKIGVVMGREYLQRVRKKTFIISTIALPLVMVTAITLSAVFSARGAGQRSEIVLVDRSGMLSEHLLGRLEASGLAVTVVPPDSPEMEEAFARAEEGDLSGILEVDSSTLESGFARWTGEDEPSALRRANLRQAVSQAAVRIRIEEVLGDAEAVEGFQRLLAGGELEVVTLREESLDTFQRMAGFGAGFVGAMLLYVTLLTYGTMVMRATLEEKTGRIAEVVLSSLHPRELMLGKIFGVGAVGFTQLAIWIGALMLVASAAVPTLLALLPSEMPIDTDTLAMLRAAVPAVGVALFFLLCFTLGFLTYASLFAAVGAMCSSEEEAQQLQLPLVMLVVVPMALISPVLRDPSSTFAVLVSLFPLFSPVLMFARVASGAAPLWQAALSIVLMSGALFLVATIAGRIYRVGILMQGKRPTLPEIVRWARES